jgi:ornithine decarboxylase
VDKIAEEWPEVSILVRLAVATNNSGTKMEGKFGANARDCLELIAHARAKGLTVTGVCMHLGSTGSTDRIDSFRRAFADILWIFREAREKHGVHLKMIDIGGGFVWDTGTFGKQATTLKEEIENLTAQLDSDVEIISEPGTFFVQQAGFSAARVICVKDVTDGSHEKRPVYVIDDGVFSSFNLCLSYPGCFESDVVTHGHRTRPQEEYPDHELHSSVLFGHTCDPCDVISRDISLPLLKEGDWVWFEGLGSYGHCVGTRFNGFKGPTVVYFDGNSYFNLEEVEP